MDKEQLYIMIKSYDQIILRGQKLWDKINRLKPKEMSYFEFHNLIEQARLDNKLIDKFMDDKVLDCKSLIYRGADKKYLYEFVTKIDNLTSIQKKLIDDLRNIKKEKNFPYTYDREISDTRIITKKEFDRLVNKMQNNEEFLPEELDVFLLKEDKNYIAVDNNTGNMWTEEFCEEEKAIRYLQGESIDKLRDEECKYEICIYETKQDYNMGEPFQLDIYSNLEDAKKELKHTIDFNNYFSGNIINQENGKEEFACYSNEKDEEETI